MMTFNFKEGDNRPGFNQQSLAGACNACLLMSETFSRLLTGHPKLGLVSQSMAPGTSGMGEADKNMAGYALSHTQGTACP